LRSTLLAKRIASTHNFVFLLLTNRSTTATMRHNRTDYQASMRASHLPMRHILNMTRREGECFRPQTFLFEQTPSCRTFSTRLLGRRPGEGHAQQGGSRRPWPAAQYANLLEPHNEAPILTSTTPTLGSAPSIVCRHPHPSHAVRHSHVRQPQSVPSPFLPGQDSWTGLHR
jgi:hypothetical protein